MHIPSDNVTPAGFVYFFFICFLIYLRHAPLFSGPAFQCSTTQKGMKVKIGAETFACLILNYRFR